MIFLKKNWPGGSTFNLSFVRTYYNLGFIRHWSQSKLWSFLHRNSVSLLSFEWYVEKITRYQVSWHLVILIIVLPFPCSMEFKLFLVSKTPMKCLISSVKAFCLPTNSSTDTFATNVRRACDWFVLGGRAEWGIIPEVKQDNFLACENSRHFVTSALVSPQNDVWEVSPEIPYWWRVTIRSG